ncbi:Secreted RxLR effector peptide protein [Phytophthora palmivora]|uniref:Secreted RxLR effector peptide protein n=1 Tax=Phytophthora palmivora TaxID=4796 RepID=A0A2P4XZM6_9STRA|nr:Secreted RxLR effector peptide protein [Phytophthora palmivora]
MVMMGGRSECWSDEFTDDELAKLVQALAAGQKRASISNYQVNNVSAMKYLSQDPVLVAQKDKESWYILKEVIVGTLGVSVGGSIIYTTVKLVTNDSA